MKIKIPLGTRKSNRPPPEYVKDWEKVHERTSYFIFANEYLWLLGWDRMVVIGMHRAPFWSRVGHGYFNKVRCAPYEFSFATATPTLLCLKRRLEFYIHGCSKSPEMIIDLNLSR